MKELPFFFLLVFLTFSGFAQHPKKAMKAYETAESAFMSRDYKKAHQQALKAVIEDPN